MASYIPNIAEPLAGDDTPDLATILKEVKQGCPGHESTLVHARELQDWYDGESEKYIAFKPAEDALSWLTRPKRVSFITRQAVNKLCSHLYKPGPRHRRITSDAAVDVWYNRVAQDIQLNGLMQQADRLATLHGLCAIGIYPTGNPGRPINYHLFPRQDFVYWASPDDPRVATAVCTITRTSTDHNTIRYRLWTKSHYYTFFKGKTWGYTPGGWNVARFDPGSSGPHPYGVLPFAFVTHELPTTELQTRGLGHLLAKINRALNIDKSNLALWVHHYARPLGFVSGVGPEWRPRFIDGGFVILAARPDSTESAPIIPEAKYLESSIDIAALREYIRGEANEALAELDIPLTIMAQASGSEGGGAMRASGISIAAQDADLITYAKGRQPLFELHETRLAALVCRIAASAGTAEGAGIDGTSLDAVARDPSLRIAWPEPSIDLPGPDRDNADTFELVNDLTDPIELLMRRQGLTEPEATEQYRAIQRRKQIAAALAADPSAELPVVGSQLSVDDEDSGDSELTTTPDMGIGENVPSPETAPASDAQPNVSVTVAVDPQFPIPAAPLILPATPGYGSWGTES
jgi:hypothetical protein